jgi:Resolvase, N terminal domain
MKLAKHYQRIGIYARVSSDQQAEAGTIASQVAALEERVGRDGLALDPELRFLDEGYSGSTLVRPALERLRDLAAAGAIDRLYVHSPDRLARKYAYQVLLVDELQRCGTELDDHFANRCAAATGLDKMGRLRQAGKSPCSRGKDVHDAKSICASNCLGSRNTKSLARSHPGPLHAASLGLSLSADLAGGSERSAVQFTGCQRIWLRSQHRHSVAKALSPARSRWSARCTAIRSAAELSPPMSNWKSSPWPPAKPASMIASPVNGVSTISRPSWSTATPTKR